MPVDPESALAEVKLAMGTKRCEVERLERLCGERAGPTASSGVAAVSWLFPSHAPVSKPQTGLFDAVLVSWGCCNK